jgi:hypothetical protein
MLLSGFFLKKSHLLMMPFSVHTLENRSSSGLHSEGAFAWNSYFEMRFPSGRGTLARAGLQILLHYFKRYQGTKRARPHPTKRYCNPCSGSGSAW